MVVGFVVVVAATSLLAYGVSVLTADHALPHAVGIGLIFLWGFALAALPKTAAVGAMTLTMAIVVTTMAAVSTDLAGVVIASVLTSVAIGIALVFLAHAVFPQRLPPQPPAVTDGAVVGVGARAIVATLILLPLHLALTAEGLAAMVVPLTVATMLRQVRVERAADHAVSFAAGNLLGGLVAAAAVMVVSLHDTLPVLVTVTAAAALLMAWWIERAPALSPVLLPGFVAFAMLFGLAFAPASLSADVDLAKRLVQIGAASLYALCAISLALPFMRGPRPGAGRPLGATTLIQP
jgi:hypothetical protein